MLGPLDSSSVISGSVDLASRHFLYSEGRENLTSQRVGYEFTYRLPRSYSLKELAKGTGVIEDTK